MSVTSVDREDRLCRLNDEWSTFANANGGSADHKDWLKSDHGRPAKVGATAR